MSRPNHQLEAAVHQFSAQPGVTPDQVSQLRTAVAAESKTLDGLNTAAANGHLNGFALDEARGTQNSVGQYEKSSGVVSLPASAFSSSSAATGSDLAATVRVQSMIVAFSNSTYVDASGVQQRVSSDMSANLQSTLNGSPALVRELRRAAMTPDAAAPDHYALEHFAVLRPGLAAGGTYDGATHTMNLPAPALMTRSGNGSIGKFDVNDLTFVIGHEIQHGFNRSDKVRVVNEFNASIKRVAAGRGNVHDYTDPMQHYIQGSREDESKAEIAGWNALVSRQKKLKPGTTLNDMAMVSTSRTGDFVERDPQSPMRSIGRPDLTFNADLTLSQTPSNREAMGKHYFDRPSKDYVTEKSIERPMALGDSHASDYANYYGRWPLQEIIAAEASSTLGRKGVSEMTIDMGTIGLKEDLLEREGMDLGKRSSWPYFDSTQLPSAQHRFDHTADGVNKNRYLPIEAATDGPLHRELRKLLPEGTSEDRLAQIALAAKQGGIEAGQIRTLDVQSDRLMMTGQIVGTRAIVDLNRAPPPAQESNQQFQATEQAQQQMMQEQQSQAQSAQQSGPVMSMGG